MSETNLPIVLTEGAQKQLLELMEEQELDPAKCFLRLWVAGGGCSGLSYGMAIDEDVDEDDLVFESDGVKAVVDPMSYRFVAGSTVDYDSDSGLGGGFKVDNPNATSTCGCKSSFRAEGGDAPSGGCSGCSQN
jgi:iron-sulfur cluster assembly protein